MANRIYFEERINKFESIATKWAQQSRTISIVRVIVFITGTVATIYFANAKSASLMFVVFLFALAIMIILIRIHNKVKYKRNHANFLKQINQDEINRLDGKLSTFDQGNEYMDDLHPYSSDLDIFGSNSLFQFINRTITQPGRSMLVKWLQNQESTKEIEARQESVKELGFKSEWCDELRASAMHFENEKSDIQKLVYWLDNPEKTVRPGLLYASGFFMPILNLIALAAFFYWGASFYWLLSSLAISGVFLSRTMKTALETGRNTADSVKAVKAFSTLIRQIEDTTFESKLLIELRQNLQSDRSNTSREIKKLQYLLQVFDSRSNAFYFIFDLIFLIDIHLLIYADKWKLRNHSKANLWFESVAGFEALISLSGSLFTHDELLLPSIRESSYNMRFSGIGHPLIPLNERVVNDFSIGGKGLVVVITGSNMSGKSTFLRTIGVNMILGLMGGPVCAREAEMPVMQVFSGMRVKDNLEEHISSFYAELKRIRQLLDMLQLPDTPVFYLLDEILKGTNSEDRHKGSEALIFQLAETSSLGLISTHDLILGNIEKKSDKIVNYNFSSEISGDEIIFNYKVNNGICKSFNASKLMEKMGISINHS